MLDFVKKAEKFYKIAIILGDLALINISYVLAFLIRYNWTLPTFNFDPYLAASPFITIMALIYFDMFGLLKFYRKSIQEVSVALLKSIFLLAVTTVTITYYLQGFSFPRLILAMAPAFQFVLLLLWKGFVLYIRKLLLNDINLMVIGERSELGIIIDKVDHTLRKSKLHIKCIIPSDEMGKAFKRLKDVDEVFISDNVSDDDKMKIITVCLAQKKVVYIVPRLFEISLSSARMVQFEDMPAFMVDRLGLTVEQRFFKRTFDIAFSFLGIIITLPLMLFAACLVKFTSKGPVLYRQTRLTAGNKQFKVIKFRTMYDGAETETGPVLSNGDDPRITRVGRVLRNLRIDELPQLFNVLKGDMSFVGPRPERPFFVEQYTKEIPEYVHRYLVKAGITGYAQIYGKYDTTPVDKLRYDLLYIKDYSLLLDVKLILQTVKVLTGKKAVYQGGKNGNEVVKSGKNAAAI
ncbi:MAG TPA: sugar transferase [Clostridia bacterium]|nr:sugar transferase [Clostridia bacterium]